MILFAVYLISFVPYAVNNTCTVHRVGLHSLETVKHNFNSTIVTIIWEVRNIG